MMAPSGSARNSTTVPAFVDTNVAVYALGRDSEKKVPVLPWLYVAIVTELCRQVLGLHPRELVVLERSEFALYLM